MKVEVLGADHQNKPDVGSTIARTWYDVDKVDAIFDVPTSSVALAVNQITRDKGKAFMVSGAATSDLTGKACSPNTIHWTYDTWMLANGTGSAIVKTGGDSWFFLTADYAFGHALERDTEAAVHQGRRQGARQGAPSVPGPGLQLVPAAGAGVQGQGHRPGQRRRRHHQLDQAGRRVRHRQGRPEPGRHAGVHHRRARPGPEHRAGPDLHRVVLLGPERPDPRLEQALRRGQRRQVPVDGAGRRVLVGAALPEGGRSREDRRRHQGHRADEGHAHRRPAVRQGLDPRRRPQDPPGLPGRGEEAVGVEGPVRLLQDPRDDPGRPGLPADEPRATARW